MIFAMVSSISPFEEDPSNFVRRDYSDKEKDILLEYMRSFTMNAAGGYIWDCVEGKELRQANVGFEDDTYMWSTQDIYHVENYNAAVKDDFLKRAISKGITQ